MSTGKSFFASSGSSPPLDGADAPSLPPELVEALATLLAQAIVGDIRQYPNLAELQPNPEPTVESPSGLNRRTRSAPLERGIAGRAPALSPGRQAV
jgi:hypothetical protein